MAKSYVRFALMAVVVLSFGRPVSSSDQAGSLRDKLVGAWRLVSEEDRGADGKMVKLDRSGVLMYSRDGHMAVEIMAPPGSAAETGPVKYEEGGFEAYFGGYKVDETARTVTHHVEGALVRSLIGKDLTRVYRFSGRQLILTSSRLDEHWTIVWERYADAIDGPSQGEHAVAIQSVEPEFCAAKEKERQLLSELVNAQARLEAAEDAEQKDLKAGATTDSLGADESEVERLQTQLNRLNARFLDAQDRVSYLSGLLAPAQRASGGGCQSR